MFIMNIKTENAMLCEVVDIPKALKGVPLEEIGEIAGVEFLKLRHAVKRKDFELTMRGFQGGTIYESNNGDFKFAKTVDGDGKDCFRPRNVTFIPSKRTKLLEAYVPDTKYNRKVLANLFFTPDAPHIYDRKVRDEVEEMAKNLGIKKKLEKNVNETVVVLSADLSKKDKEIAKLKKQLEKVEIVNRTISKSAAQIDSSKVEAEREKILQECIKDVEKENQDLMKALMKMYPKAFRKKDEYFEGIVKKAKIEAEKIYKIEGLNVDD